MVPTMNGLHAFADKQGALREMARLEEGRHLRGLLLGQGPEDFTDIFTDSGL